MISALHAVARLEPGTDVRRMLETIGFDFQLQNFQALHEMACSVQGADSLAELGALFGVDEETVRAHLTSYNQLIINSGGFQGRMATSDIGLKIYYFLREVSGSPEGSLVDMAVFREKLTREQLHKFVSDLHLYYGADVLGDVTPALIGKLVHTSDIYSWVTALLESADATELAEAMGMASIEAGHLLRMVRHIGSYTSDQELIVYRDVIRAASEVKVFYLVH